MLERFCGQPAAFGVDALVMTERHSPELTGVLAKAASGGLEHVAIVNVVNLARALEKLGGMGYLRVGLDSEGESTLADTALTRPVALVLGGEGKGMRPPHARELRLRSAARYAGDDQKPQCLQRLRRSADPGAHAAGGLISQKPWLLAIRDSQSMPRIQQTTEPFLVKARAKITAGYVIGCPLGCTLMGRG